MSKITYPAELALAVAREICGRLKPCCTRLVIAGSLRRRRDPVGDVEVVYVPRWGDIPDGLFTKHGDLARAEIDLMLEDGTLAKRLRRDSPAPAGWGPQNRLAVHLETGVPVDLFATVEPHWFNYLVCRTGGMKNNVEIASAALAKNLTWHPYKSGFSDASGNVLKASSEEDVYRIAGLPYLPPQKRP
jgi:DNA polymerase/3'-5' exonuclease PolX